MNDPFSRSESEFEPLNESAIVYRALLRRQWIDETSDLVLLFAYLLRRNEPGLSVTIASVCSPEQCAAKFKNCYGVAIAVLNQSQNRSRLESLQCKHLARILCEQII